MLTLESSNRLITKLLLTSLAKPTSVDQAFVDFDSVRYHLSTPSKKTVLVLSMAWDCYAALKGYGADEVIQREYGQWVAAEVEHDYDVSLEIDLEKIPAEGPERSALLESFALLKRNVLAAPFERAFAIQKQLEANPAADDALPTKQELMSVHYRPEESIYLLPSSDRVTVLFSTLFADATDAVYGRVFLQEFVDARRRPSCQTAPQVLYSNREPPLELRGMGMKEGDKVGYVTFVLFPRHFSSPETAFGTISQIQLFRDYLHYHIKCSKAYMHSRMRHRVAEFLKVLNRAKPEQEERERKTASGRTFVRA